MSKISVLAAMLCFAVQAQAQTTNVKAIEQQAMAGDYQAQRNLAYGYVAWPYTGQTKNPITGCAWYLVVLNSGSPQLGPGDVGNVQVYCGRLDPDSKSAAINQSRVLFKQIYRREPKY